MILQMTIYVIIAIIDSSAYTVCSDLQLEVILDFLISEQQDSSPGSDVHSWNSWRVWTVYLSTKFFKIINTKYTKKKKQPTQFKDDPPQLT